MRGCPLCPLSVLLALAAIALLSALALADTPPPTSGNWTVADETSVDGTDITIDGSVIVADGGALSLANLTLVMDPVGDGVEGIYVREGGRLSLVNVTLRSSDPDIHYWFEARGPVDIIGSDVRDVASNTGRWDRYYEIAGGVQIYNSSSWLIGSRFHASQRIAVYVSHATPVIRDCEFFDTEYASSYSLYRYVLGIVYGYAYIYYTDATGLFLDHSSPDISSCDFSNNGIDTTALQYYNTSYSTNGVVTLGRGILAYESSPNITDCSFRFNGLQPAYPYGYRTVQGVDQYFFDYFYYDDMVEGGLACYGTTSHPRVYSSTFVGNDAFGISGYDRAFPVRVDGCTVQDTRFMVGNTVYSPSGGIYIDEGIGTMTVANTTFSKNHVDANIHVESGPDVRLVNYTNSDFAVANGCNVYLGVGNHLIQDSVLDGGYDALANLYIAYARSRVKVHILESRFLGALFGIDATNQNGADILMTNSSVSGNSHATFSLQATIVDCVNCTFSHLYVEGVSYGRGSTVRISYYLTVEVTWQNQKSVEGAFVNIVNTTEEYLHGGKSDRNGTTGPLIIPSKVIEVTYYSHVEYTHSPISVMVSHLGLTSNRTGISFDQNLGVSISLNDPTPPVIHISGPRDGHMQAGTPLLFKGMCVDAHSGVDRVEVYVDKVHRTTVEGSTWCVTFDLPEGVHVLLVGAFDGAGNEAWEEVGNVTIDMTPPVLELLEPDGPVHYTTMDQVRVLIRTEVDTTVVVDHSTTLRNEGGLVELFLTMTTDGHYDHWFSAVDRVGHTNQTSLLIVRDTVMPRIVMGPLPERTPTALLVVRATVLEVNLEEVWLNDLLMDNGTVNHPILLEEGRNEVVLYAIDRANNTHIEIRTVVLDTTPPVLTLHKPLEGSMHASRSVPVVGYVGEEVLELLVDGYPVEVVGERFETKVVLEEGENGIVIEATDLVGNRGEATVRVFVDTVPPVIEVHNPLDGSVLDDRVVMMSGSVTGAESISVNSIEVFTTDWFEMELHLPETPTWEPPYTITIVALDGVGNTASLKVRVWVDTIAPYFALDPIQERTRNGTVTIQGRLNRPLERVDLTVDGAPVGIDASGAFTVTRLLDMGENGFIVRAVDPAGNVVEKGVTIERLPREQADEGMDGTSVALLLVVAVMLGMGLVVAFRLLRAR